MTNELIKISDLNFEYEKNVPILKNINLTIPHKSIISLYGPSGSGKSTLLFLIGMLIRKYNGKIEYNFSVCYEKIGFIFQNFNLLKEMPILDNILVAQNIRGYNNKKEIYTYAEKIDIVHLLNKFPNQLSTGQLQRASILRALVGNTKIILCDEPTAALDSENKNNILEIFNMFKEEKTFFVATHDSIIKNYSDIIYEIFDGKII